ncbi:MAG: hypothetical protein HQ592_06375 [Planctomycetes bacterium]|nr:hypothetical protein [Planctomycetota bacterium]
MKKPSGSIGATYQTAREKSQSAGNELEAASTVVSEFLDLKTTGAILHPNFVELAADCRIGASQEKYKEGDTSGSSRGSLMEYDLTADILKEKRFPLRLHASRSDQVVPRRFTSSLHVSRTRHGFTLRKADRRTPMRLTFDREQVVEQAATEGAESSTAERSSLAYDVATSLGRAGRVSLGYIHSETRANLLEDSSAKDEIQIRHNVSLDDERRGRLTSSLRYSDRRGNTSLSDLDLGTQLKLQHTDNLSTTYDFSYKDRQRDQLAQQLWNARVGFTHKLYRSLKTTGRIRTSQDRYSTGRTTGRRGGALSVNYQKLNSLGTLFLGCSADYDIRDDKGTASTLFVVDESHHLSSLQETFLVEQNIIQNTISVTDPSGSPHDEITDYIVIEIAGRTTLRIAPFGSGINEGDEVRVSYQYTSPGNQRQATNTYTCYIRHAFSFGLTPYIRHTRRDVTITPSLPGVVESDERTTTIGAKQRLGRLTLSAERRDSDLATSPYRSTRYTAAYYAGRRRGVRLNLSADYSDYEYFPPNRRETRVYNMRATIKQTVTKTLNLTYAAGYRKEESSDAGPTSSIVGRAGLTWAFRTFRFAANVEHSRGNYSSGKVQRTSLTVGLERRF